jgi:hypothetical protein
LRLATDDLSAHDRAARARAHVPVPSSPDEALAALLDERDESVATLAAHHAIDLGTPRAREGVRAAAARRPSLGALFGLAVAAAPLEAEAY